MAKKTSLSDRHLRILWATIRHYITTAEPVGSKTLVNEYDFSVSSATIRNAMGWLEKAGLLYQPHTSAGRIPSDSGYRVYVDRLLIPNKANQERIEKLLTKQLNWEAGNLEILLRGAAQMLATLSGYIAIITMPQNSTTQVRHVQLVQVAPDRAMLILVTDSYETQSILIELPGEENKSAPNPELNEGELQILSNFLNSKLKGRSLTDLSSLDWRELGREFERYANLIRKVQKELSRRQQLPNSTPIMVRGIAEALRLPEFSELQQVQMLLHLLEEEQDQLLPLIFELPEGDNPGKKVSIKIGSENPLEPLNTCTLVSSVYRQKDVPVGSVGILGPTRMLYENAIALVESVADYVSDALTQAA
ncbi:heat-inducible transcriptional repressor HrcA [Oscillatoria salina]|uniref:heat-inducible transcriptional repressor HrcA n=1 Tax=Oscillatoria salina TaxID=331517 RepID=UPI001CCDF141|nr:heat-inducible transcriptional repressor HrcA [Oscillatoria salina]MBZ8180469.1 heat-inducible transcriptional repressor HrcA [Oscillatoria salina IIICB1]